MRSSDHRPTETSEGVYGWRRGKRFLLLQERAAPVELVAQGGEVVVAGKHDQSLFVGGTADMNGVARFEC